MQIADGDRKIATLYDMLDYQDATNKDAKGLPFTIRTVFIIDPKKTIRLTLAYPAAVGRNFVSVLLELLSSFICLASSSHYPSKPFPAPLRLRSPNLPSPHRPSH